MPHLWFVRRGLFDRECELTDHTHLYGKLTYQWLGRRIAVAETAADKWSFKFLSIFPKTLIITNETGAIVGEAKKEYFSRVYTLNLKSGFRARFHRLSIFSREHIWESEGYGKIVTLKNGFPFALANDIYIEPSQTPVKVIPLLIFLGMHLAFYRRGRRAAH